MDLGARARAEIQDSGAGSRELGLRGLVSSLGAEVDSSIYTGNGVAV